MKNHFYILILVLILVFGIFLFSSLKLIDQMNLSYEKDYNKKFILINNNQKSFYWEKIEKGLSLFCNENNIALEVLKKDDVNFISEEELLTLAISTNPNGIIMSGKNSNKLKKQLESALKNKIPVIFIDDEGINTLRSSYIGPNNYKIGQNMIKELLALEKKKYNALLLYKSEDQNKNLLIDGILSEVETHGNIEIKEVFSSEKYKYKLENTIRKVLNSNSDINLIIGPSNYTGADIAELIIKMDKVGEVDIASFDNSPETLGYINKDIISIGIYIDGETMGKKSGEVLSNLEKEEFNFDVHYIPSKIITHKNIDDYIKGDVNDE